MQGAWHQARQPPAFLTPNIRPLAPAGSEYQVLYIADDNEIRSLFPSHPHSAYEQAFQGDESVRIDAMDVHIKAGRVYWTNWHTGTISYRNLPPAAPPTTSNRHRREIDRGVTHLNVSTSQGWGSERSWKRTVEGGGATGGQGRQSHIQLPIPLPPTASVLPDLGLPLFLDEAA